MKRRYIVITSLVLLFIAFLGGALYFMKPQRTDMSKVENGSVHFAYDDENIATELADEDLDIIKDIFDHKKLYKDNPSCGFTEQVSVSLNDDSEIFCIACDTCPILYSKKDDRYFKLSERDNTVMRELLKNYGFHFPCQ